jgi:hypothetical protein
MKNGTRGGEDQVSRKWCDEVSNGCPTLQTIFSGTLRSERRHVKNEAGQVRASTETEAAGQQEGLASQKIRMPPLFSPS